MAHHITEKKICDLKTENYIHRGTWGETGHWGNWDSLNIKIRSLPLGVLSCVLTQLGFRRTCDARIAKITQAVCGVTT